MFNEILSVTSGIDLTFLYIENFQSRERCTLTGYYLTNSTKTLRSVVLNWNTRSVQNSPDFYWIVLKPIVVAILAAFILMLR